MILFISALAFLIIGYFVYGYFIEKIIGVDSEKATPAYSKQDGVDFIPMPTWKVFLIQFLNIAGIGPIFGAIMGIEYGPSAFLWITLGTIFAGAVHDYVSGMISLRMNGLSLPDIVGSQLGQPVKRIMAVFTVFLLIMVIAVFVVTPAELLANMTPDVLSMGFWIAMIFIYYILATLLPIDKIIGNLYPVFGGALLFMALGLIGMLLFGGIEIPTGISEGLYDRMPDPAISPIFPMMFVSIACGAISGFHATQSPMMARCLRTERHGRFVFYGAMVAEGIVALVWAAVAISYFGGYDQLTAYIAEGHKAGDVVSIVCKDWLGVIGGILAILGVIAAPITTGDTAMRSARLIIADVLHIDQRKLMKRLLVTIPLIVICTLMMMIDFSVLWRYFGWSNQSLAIFTLWACSLWLLKKNRNLSFLVTLIPAMFMTVVCVSYILFAPFGDPKFGIGLPYEWAVTAGIIVSFMFLALFVRTQQKISIQNPKKS